MEEICMDEIAIVLATYNGSTYLREQLDSIVNQSYQNIRCYIHDDGSTDNTVEIIEYYVEKYPREFILLDYPPLRDANKNFLSILPYVKESYIMLCDQDDVWLANKVYTTYEHMKLKEKENPNVGILVFSDLSLVDENLNVIKESYTRYKRFNIYKLSQFRKVLITNVSCGCTMMVNRKLLDVLTCYKEADNIVMHDYWFFLVASACGIIHYIDEPLMLYRQHSDNTCGAEEKFMDRRINDLKYLFRSSFKDLIIEKKKWINERRIQASELLKIDREGYWRIICEEFVKSSKKKYFARQLFYAREHMYSRHRFLKMIFWG